MALGRLLLTLCRTAGPSGLLAAAVLALPAPAVAAPDTPVVLREAAARSAPVLRPGDRGRWVRRLNVALHVDPDSRVFHRGTARAVKQFRRAHGLQARAVVTRRVWRLLGAASAPQAPAPPPAAPVVDPGRPVLQYGDTSPWVAAVQRALGVEPASGWFGPRTRAAVVAAQTGAGLPPTGIVDTATWAVLADAVAAPPPDPTMLPEARTSTQWRATVGVEAFTGSWAAHLVVDRESRGDCGAVSPNGLWRGRWQMDSAFWATYGGTRFAATADAASCEQQDLVAYAGWVDRWWYPWRTDTFPG